MNNSQAPAFPSSEYARVNDWQGLTKREEFAKAAMQGLLAAGNRPGSFTDGLLNSYAGWTADAATRIADALLAELAKEVK